MRKVSLIVLGMVGLAFFGSSLTFDYGLDDTALQIGAERSIGNASLPEVLAAVSSTISNPPPADSCVLYRPLRLAYSWGLLFVAGKIPWLPKLLSAFMAVICGLVLLRCHTLGNLSPRVALFAALWFFGCIPVVAMGQVVFVCQFIVISGLYLVLMLFQWYVDTRKPMWLLLASLAVFIFGLYAEAMLLAPLAVGVQGLIWICRRNLRGAALAFAFSGLGCFLVLGNAFLMTGDPGQFTRGIRSVLAIRNYDVSETDYLHILSNTLRGYSHSFRPEMFTGIFFSVSPLLFLLGIVAFAGIAVVKRRFAILGVLAAAGVVAYWNPAWGIGALFVSLCLRYAASYPLFVSMLVSGLFVLGPIFVIDTHITYLLPALIGLLFVALDEACCWLQLHQQRILVWCPAAALILVAVTNFGSGAYLCARVANDNRQVASLVGDAVRSGSVLVNFRHAVDLYFYANEGRKFSDYEGNIYFTATVPLWGEVWGEDRAVRDEKRLHDWFESAASAGKPVYFLVIDHDRLPHKSQFHGPRFLTSPHYDYTLRDMHVFQAAVPFLDPGFLLVNYFHKRGLTAGFIGYPVFPDMIDDIGVEYGLFTKRLFVCYRLLEVTKRDEGFVSITHPDYASEERVVLSNYLGYDVVAERQHFVARCPIPGGKVSSGAIVSEKLDLLLRKIRDSSEHSGQPAGECEHFLPVLLIEEGVRGFNILACGDRFFGLAQDEGAFDLDRLRSHKYRRCVEGGSVEEVKRLIENEVSRNSP